MRGLFGANAAGRASLTHHGAVNFQAAESRSCCALETCRFVLADTPEEAARRMIEHRKLSAKINYNVLADLFSDDPQPDDDYGAEAGLALG